jgi:nickel-dependent lactate racemase
MKTISVPWKAWHSDDVYELTFLASWEVKGCPMADAPSASESESEIQQARSGPIACPPLELMARGRKRVAIAVDDLTRPAPTRRRLPFVLERLHSAGITAKQLTIVLALGSHPPLTTSELRTNLRGDILREYKVLQHHASQQVGEIV